MCCSHVKPIARHLHTSQLQTAPHALWKRHTAAVCLAPPHVRCLISAVVATLYPVQLFHEVCSMPWFTSRHPCGVLRFWGVGFHNQNVSPLEIACGYPVLESKVVCLGCVCVRCLSLPLPSLLLLPSADKLEKLVCITSHACYSTGHSATYDLVFC